MLDLIFAEEFRRNHERTNSLELKNVESSVDLRSSVGDPGDSRSEVLE